MYIQNNYYDLNRFSMPLDSPLCIGDIYALQNPCELLQNLWSYDVCAMVLLQAQIKGGLWFADGRLMVG